MQKEIIVNSTPYEVRIAILEDKELVELLIERPENQRIVGDIYKGVVTAVLPGIQAAFVDIGQEKAAFLHVSDVVDPREDIDDDPSDRRNSGGHNSRQLPAIQDLLQKGEEILVQVTKEPIATKGPRITTQVSLPGRFAVIMPNANHMGVSRKIEDRNERNRLKQLVRELKPPECALIVRTVGEGVQRNALENDVSHLVTQWDRIKEKAASAPAPSLIHKDVGMVIGLVRDVFNEDVGELVLDSQEDYDELVEYLKDFAPELRERVKLYTDAMPVFDKYGIENEIEKTLDRKVWLKKGGYLIIEQTEALVSVDVNTGRFTGKRNQEETIFKTNMLAARELARQLRLRDVGGIIVVDFIDMESEQNKKRVLQELRNYLKNDRAKTKTFQISDLGLVEMSRQRVRPSLYHYMSDQCRYCESTGHVLSLDSITNKIERMVRRVSHYTRERQLRLQANPSVMLFLREDRYSRIKELMEETEVTIDLVDDPRLHREDFRLLSVQTGEDLMRRVASPHRNGNQRPQQQQQQRSAGNNQSSGQSSSSGEERSGGRRRGGRGRGRRGGRGSDRSRGGQRNPVAAEERRGDGLAPQSRAGESSGNESRGRGRGDGRDSGRGDHRNEARGSDSRGNDSRGNESRGNESRGNEPRGNEVRAEGQGDEGRGQGQGREGGRSRGRRRRGSRGRGRRGRPILEDNPALSTSVAQESGAAPSVGSSPPSVSSGSSGRENQADQGPS